MRRCGARLVSWPEIRGQEMGSILGQNCKSLSRTVTNFGGEDYGKAANKRAWIARRSGSATKSIQKPSASQASAMVGWSRGPVPDDKRLGGRGKMEKYAHVPRLSARNWGRPKIDDGALAPGHQLEQHHRRLAAEPIGGERYGPRRSQSLKRARPMWLAH